MEENKELEIDLKKIFSMLKRRILYIILVGIIGGILAGCYTNIFITPQYTTTVKLHAYSNNEYLISSNGSMSSNDFNVSKEIINSYLVVVKSDSYLEKVADKLGKDISASAIKGMLNCSQIENTVTFRVSITNSDPKLAAEIANLIADTCPDEIVRVYKVGGVEVIDYAKVPTSQSSPDTKKNIMIGALAGLALSFAFFFIKELFDTSVNNETDLKREFDIPILGSVPKLVTMTDKQKASIQNNLEPPMPSITDFTDKEDE